MAKSNRRPKGSGSKRQIGKDKWEVSASNGQTASGKQRRKYKVVNGSDADAEQEIIRLKAVLGARPNAGDTLTLDAYFYGIFLQTHPMRALTAATYKSVYKTYIGPAFGSWPADKITRMDIQLWVMQLPTPATASKAYRHLRAILRAMWDDELLDEEPLRRSIRLPRHTLAPKEIWTAEELSEALDRLRGEQLEAIVSVMGGGGLRREEAMGLDLPQSLAFGELIGADGKSHLACRTIIKSTWVEVDGQHDETKTYRIRQVTIGEPFASHLKEAISDGRPKLLMRRDGSAPLAPPSVPETWRRAFNPGRPLAGMRYVELRTLRHCHETLSARAGVGNAINASVHGHSPQVMATNYLSFDGSDADTVAEAIRQMFTR